MPSKLTEAEAAQYWIDVHEKIQDPITAVCHSQRSKTVNLMFDFMQRSAIRNAMDRLPRTTQRPQDMLDIGCGRGRWLRMFEDRGYTPQGIDISPTAVDYCRALGLNARVAKADALPFEAASFDLVSSITVLLHLPPRQQRSAAAEMARVTRPGGYVLLLEPTKPDDAPHVWPRSVGAWLALFPGWSADIVEAHYFAPLLRLYWAIRLPDAEPKPRPDAEVSAPARPLWHRALSRGRRAGEPVVAAASWPFELAVTRAFRGRPSRLARQHLFLLGKPGTGLPE